MDHHGTQPTRAVSDPDGRMGNRTGTGDRRRNERGLGRDRALREQAHPDNGIRLLGVQHAITKPTEVLEGHVLVRTLDHGHDVRFDSDELSGEPVTTRIRVEKICDHDSQHLAIRAIAQRRRCRQTRDGATQHRHTGQCDHLETSTQPMQEGNPYVVRGTDTGGEALVRTLRRTRRHPPQGERKVPRTDSDRVAFRP